MISSTASAPVPTTSYLPAEEWFASRGWAPFDFQREVWSAYLAGESGLIHAATGTGKTYAAWWGPLLEAMQEQRDSAQPRRPSLKSRRRSTASPLRVLWITPLRALAADTEAALRAPTGDLDIHWTVETRTSDTSAAARSRQRRQLPTALVTTPESLTIMLSRDDAPDLFHDLRVVVVDEWHELMGTKRGVQTELALARLRRLRPSLRTWGLSATIGNLEDARTALLGVSANAAPSRIIRGVEAKRVIVDALIPPTIE